MPCVWFPREGIHRIDAVLLFQEGIDGLQRHIAVRPHTSSREDP